MGILARQGIINSVIIYTGFAIGYLNVGILLPLYFTPDQIGVRETIMAYAMTLASFGLVGNTNALMKFFPKYSKLSKHGLVGVFLSIAIITGVVTTGVFAIVSHFFIQPSLNNFSLFRSYTPYIIPFGLSLMIIAVFDTYFRSISLAHISVFLREFVIRVLTTCAVLGFGLKFYEFEIFVQLLLISHIIIIIYYCYHLLTKTNSIIVFSRKIVRLIDFKPIYTFAIFGFIAGAANILILQVDKMMITSMINEANTAIYAIAIYLATLIEAPKRALLQSTGPFISKAWKDSNHALLQNISKKASINLQIVGSLLFLLLWCSIDEIYHIIPKEGVFTQGKYVVFIIGLSKLLNMIFGVNNEIIGYSPRYKLNLYLSILLAITTVSLNYVLIPIYGIIGAAIASLITLMILNLVRQFFIIMYFKISPLNKKNIYTALLAISIGVLISYIPFSDNEMISIILKSSLIGVSYISGVYLLDLSEEFNGIVNKYIKHKKSDN